MGIYIHMYTVNSRMKIAYQLFIYTLHSGTMSKNELVKKLKETRNWIYVENKLNTRSGKNS